MRWWRGTCGTGGRLAAITLLCLLIGEVTGSLVAATFGRLSQADLHRLTAADLDHLPGGPPAVFRPALSD